MQVGGARTCPRNFTHKESSIFGPNLTVCILRMARGDSTPRPLEARPAAASTVSLAQVLPGQQQQRTTSLPSGASRH